MKYMYVVVDVPIDIENRVVSISMMYRTLTFYEGLFKIGHKVIDNDVADRGGTGVGQGPQSHSLGSAHGLLEKAQRAMFPSHLVWTEAGHIKSILSSPRFNPICHVHVHQPPGPPLVTPWVCHKARCYISPGSSGTII